jgi:membrane protease subunit HflC
MDRRWIVVLSIAAATFVVWTFALFTVPVWMQAIVVQLGNPVRTITEPGLYLKVPFIQEVTYFDKRLLDYDASPKEILTKDKQQLVVDNYSRWRIDDPLQFFRSLRSEAGAQSRLDDIVYSNLRETLGRHTLREIVSEKRSALMTEVTATADEKMRPYGVRVIDVRIKRADLPEQNERNVFNRMRTERERLAKKFRAEGDEESRKIRSDADKQVRILTADARQKADIVRGEGDAGAARIFAEAYGRDPEFYEFVRTMDAYRRTIDQNTTLILSPQSEFFRWLGATQHVPDAAARATAPAR